MKRSSAVREARPAVATTSAPTAAQPRKAAAPERVPTLTEVVELDSVFPSTQVPMEEASLYTPEADAAFSAALAQELGAEVLHELQQHVSTLLEARLREGLAPALARAADGLVRDAQEQLSGALRELVEDAVARALERRQRR